MSTFVSMTAHCARCHDHKFDPILARGLLQSAGRIRRCRSRRPAARSTIPQIFRSRNELLAERKALESLVSNRCACKKPTSRPEIEQLEKQISAWKLKSMHRSGQSAARDQAENPGEGERRPKLIERTGSAHCSIPPRETKDRLAPEIEAVNKKISRPSETPSRLRGSKLFRSLRHLRPRHSIRVPFTSSRAATWIPPARLAPPRNALLRAWTECTFRYSRRIRRRRAPRSASALDHRRNNMLTWRSIVNRVWQYHFGMGIVDSARTISDAWEPSPQIPNSSTGWPSSSATTAAPSRNFTS